MPAENDEVEKEKDGGGCGIGSEEIEPDMFYCVICLFLLKNTDNYYLCDWSSIWDEEARRRRSGGSYGSPGGLGQAENDEGEKEEDGGGYGYGSEEIQPDMFYYFIYLFLY